MKRINMLGACIIASVSLLAACGSSGTLKDEMKKSAIANPWGETQSLTVAIESSEVDFIPPKGDKVTAAGISLPLKTYRYMQGIIEALYTEGDAELRIRKSSEMEGQELSGDYNAYPEEWNENIGGIEVHLRGDKGKAFEATYKEKNGNYAILFRNGEKGEGMSVDELESLRNLMSL